MMHAGKWACVLALACTITLACTTMFACGDGDDPADAAGERDDRAAGYAEALADVDRSLAEARSLADARDRWPDHELVAKLYIQRARLTGAVEDWAAADRALVDAFAVAPAGGGPVLTRVELDLSLHQLDAAEAGIAKLEAAPLATAEVRRRTIVARAELAAQREQLDAAARAYARALELGAEPGAYASQLALLDRRQGRYDDALARLEQAAAEARSPRGRAWAMLQAGLVEWERGRPEAALVHYDAAAEAFPGWWLIDEHRAEVLAALGHDHLAAFIYRSVVDRTQHPQFMDALAQLELAAGDQARAQAYLDAAERERARRQALLPSASLH